MLIFQIENLVIVVTEAVVVQNPRLVKTVAQYIVFLNERRETGLPSFKPNYHFWKNV